MLMMEYTFSENGDLLEAIRKGILVDLDYAKDEDDERAKGSKKPISPRNDVRTSERLKGNKEEVEMDRGHRTVCPSSFIRTI